MAQPTSGRDPARVVAVCEACPTNKDRAKAVGRELVADLLIPLLTYGIVIGALIVGGAITFS